MMRSIMAIGRSRSLLIWVIGCFLLWCEQGWAQDTPAPSRQPSIHVSAEASLVVKPDQAEINVGVITQAQTAEEAATQNAKQVESVLAALRQGFGLQTDLRTLSYTLTPDYHHPKEGGSPRITGYSAVNILQVKTGELQQVGKIIDVAMQAGANTIRSLRFTLRDETAVSAQALAEATMRARRKAEAIASALGLKVGRVLSVTEGGAAEPVMYRPAREARADLAAATPVEPGMIDVREQVTLTVEVAE